VAVVLPALAEVDMYLAGRKAKGFTALQVHLLAFLRPP
jgi:hypothetical protein